MRSEIRQIWIFWIAGLVALFLGSLFSMKWDRWIGISLIIVAFAEMIWATSPSEARLFASPFQLRQEAIYKLLLSVVSLAFLLVVWFRIPYKAECDEP